MVLSLVGDEDDTHLARVDRAAGAPDQSATDLHQAIVAALAGAPEPLGRAALRDLLRVRNERLGHALTRLVAQGAVVRVGDRWGVPIPTPTQASERNADVPTA